MISGSPEYAEWIQKRVAKASSTYFFGTPITELTRDELLAMAVEAGNNLEDQRQAHARSLSMMSLFSRARGGI